MSGDDNRLRDWAKSEAQQIDEDIDEPLYEAKANIARDSSAQVSKSRAMLQRTQSRLDSWDSKLNRYPILHRIEIATGVRKVYIAIVVVACLVALIFFGLGMGVLTAIIAFLYPVYRSFKTIENPTLESLEQWLTYWVVYGVFITTEGYSDQFCSWIPFYYPLKLAFLLWCFLPSFNGATTIFHALVKPVLRSNENAIKQSLSEVHAVAKVSVNQVGSHIRRQSGFLVDAVKKRGSDWMARRSAMMNQAPMPVPEDQEQE